MALSRDKKSILVNDLTSIAKNSGSMVFVHAHGVTIPETDTLRTELRSSDSRYKVVKKTLLKIALTDAGLSGTMPDMPGEVAIAYGSDLIAPARAVYDQMSKLKDKLSIVGGVFDGVFMDQSSMMSIATIPPTPVLRGMFVNVINSPIQGMVVALSKIAEKKQG
jgi:large subunit ribosomal protein L10